VNLEQMQFLTGDVGRKWLAADLPDDEMRAIAHLRRWLPPDRASAVVIARRLRRRARRVGRSARFPDWLTEGMLADEALSQQASSFRPAVFKARRLARIAAGRGVVDVCCGMGIDAIAMGLAGLDVEAIDRDPVAVLAARHNAALTDMPGRVEVGQAQAAEIDPTGRIVHIDPQRRTGRRPAAGPEEYSPPLGQVLALAGRSDGGVVKFAPSDRDRIAGDWPGGAAWQYVSEGGTCKQLLGWWGPAARNLPTCSAVVLWGDLQAPDAETLDAQADPAAVGGPGPVLVEPDAAVRAAGAGDALAARFDLWRAGPGLELFFARRAPATRLARSFAVLGEAPGRPRDLARALAELDAGLVEVKPVGLRLDTDRLQKQLRQAGGSTITIFWAAMGPAQRCWLCRRLDENQPRDAWVE
jgi:hypothetical protein